MKTRKNVVAIEISMDPQKKFHIDIAMLMGYNFCISMILFGGNMLEIKNLSKKYKNATRYSVKDLSFTLQDGEVFGFLGKNGAGKSTTIKCITGIIPFEEGSISICGHDISSDPINAKLNIGYVPDNHAVYDNLTGREYVTYMGNIYRVEKSVIEERIKKFGAKFNMAFALDNQIRSYSHGMKQKICIMAALIHNPKFWVLDEPLMGLDPQSSYEIKQYMLEHKKLGNTVFFSSHNLEIVEKICDRVAIINKGRLIEIIDVKKFMEESDVSLEEYFLDKTKTEPPKEDTEIPQKKRTKIFSKKNKQSKKTTDEKVAVKKQTDEKVVAKKKSKKNVETQEQKDNSVEEQKDNSVEEQKDNSVEEQKDNSVEQKQKKPRNNKRTKKTEEKPVEEKTQNAQKSNETKNDVEKKEQVEVIEQPLETAEKQKKQTKKRQKKTN